MAGYGEGEERGAPHHPLGTLAWVAQSGGDGPHGRIPLPSHIQDSSRSAPQPTMLLKAQGCKHFTSSMRSAKGEGMLKTQPFY